jgi:hypothetical protein
MSDNGDIDFDVRDELAEAFRAVMTARPNILLYPRETIDALMCVLAMVCSCYGTTSKDAERIIDDDLAALLKKYIAHFREYGFTYFKEYDAEEKTER